MNLRFMIDATILENYLQFSSFCENPIPSGVGVDPHYSSNASTSQSLFSAHETVLAHLSSLKYENLYLGSPVTTLVSRVFFLRSVIIKSGVRKRQTVALCQKEVMSVAA